MKKRLEDLSDRWEAVWDVDGWPSRILLLLVLLGTGGALTLAGFSVPAERAAAGGVWIAVVLIAVVAQVHRHRHGVLIVLTPEARAADLERNGRAGSVWFYGSVLLAVGAGLAGGAGSSALYAVFGAIILSYTPLLIYVSFVPGPERDRGE